MFRYSNSPGEGVLYTNYKGLKLGFIESYMVQELRFLSQSLMLSETSTTDHFITWILYLQIQLLVSLDREGKSQEKENEGEYWTKILVT